MVHNVHAGQYVVALLDMETLAFFFVGGVEVLNSHLGVMSRLAFFMLSLWMLSSLLPLTLIPFIFCGKAHTHLAPWVRPITRGLLQQIKLAQLQHLIGGVFSWVQRRDFNGPQLLGFFFFLLFSTELAKWPGPWKETCPSRDRSLKGTWLYNGLTGKFLCGPWF